VTVDEYMRLRLPDLAGRDEPERPSRWTWCPGGPICCGAVHRASQRQREKVSVAAMERFVRVGILYAHVAVGSWTHSSVSCSSNDALRAPAAGYIAMPCHLVVII
jgi:hypothetical protein